MTKRFKQRRGFTLLEVMISMTIFLIVVGLLLGSLTNGMDFWEFSVTSSDLQSNGQHAMNMMTKELRNATRTQGMTPPDAGVLGTPPNNKGMLFYLPTDIDGNGTITDAVTGDTEWDPNLIQYDYDNVNLQLLRNTMGTQKVLANYVTDVRFNDWNTDLSLFREEIKITLQMQRNTSKGRTVTASFISTVKLRN